MKTFFSWLIAQEYRKDKVGDLARDLLLDVHLPVKKTKKKLLAHIAVESNYDSGTIETFNMAWKEYKEYRKII